MCNTLLLPLIRQFKKQDMSVFNIIYGEFEKLINFYSSHLGIEDTKSELTLFLIELLYAVDLSRFKEDCSFGVKKYIAVCIRNQYIALSKKKQKTTNLNCPLYENCAVYSELYEEKIAVEQLYSFLTEKQKRILDYRYKYGYSDREIAKRLNIKRQAVNQMRNRALEVLKTKI